MTSWRSSGLQVLSILTFFLLMLASNGVADELTVSNDGVNDYGDNILTFFLSLVANRITNSSVGGGDGAGGGDGVGGDDGISDHAKVLNVKDYGAVADGKTDDSHAFLKAWKDACERKGETVVNVPREGKYYVRQAAFAGPCKGHTVFRIQGDIYAPTDESSRAFEYWIKFRYVDHLTILGQGQLYGGGPSAWPHKSKDIPLPLSLRLEYVNNAVVKGITSVDSQDKHISIFACNDVILKGIRSTAPADSPNTDGLHISRSSGIQVIDSRFDTGDDCIAIFAGSSNVTVMGSSCGPGHGISIGSMGGGPDQVPITDITIRNCTLTKSDNGFRIKTWAADSYPTMAYNITVDDLLMVDVSNPIVIDQYYCPGGGCKDGESVVQIKDVRLKNIRGTSSTKTAVELHCSSKKPCEGIELEDIDLVYRDPDGGKVGDAVSSCSNVHGVSRGKQVPDPCI